jgi:hypothetical protein
VSLASTGKWFAAYAARAKPTPFAGAVITADRLAR